MALHLPTPAIFEILARYRWTASRCASVQRHDLLGRKLDWTPACLSNFWSCSTIEAVEARGPPRCKSSLVTGFLSAALPPYCGGTSRPRRPRLKSANFPFSIATLPVTWANRLPSRVSRDAGVKPGHPGGVVIASAWQPRRGRKFELEVQPFTTELNTGDKSLDKDPAKRVAPICSPRGLAIRSWGSAPGAFITHTGCGRGNAQRPPQGRSVYIGTMMVAGPPSTMHQSAHDGPNAVVRSARERRLISFDLLMVGREPQGRQCGSG